jgi:hypothetical protein
MNTMIKNLIYTAVISSISFSAVAQRSDNTTKSLVNAEKSFSAMAVKNGTKAAFDTYASADCLSFSPNPTNTKQYYASQPDMKNLSWFPVYAKVSRSGDWGFTTGRYEVAGQEVTYGDYLSIWKAVNGKWQLVLDLGTSHNKPLEPVKTEFVEPVDFHKPKFTNEKDILTGKGIIMTTEKTMDASLKSYGPAAFSGFLNPNARLMFPGREPIIGKDNINAFYNQMVAKISFKTTQADKALGGDLAYTYGIATIDYKADLRESFNYVNIYELQPDHNWNLILQIYTPAER